MERLEQDFIEADDAIEALAGALQSPDPHISPMQEMARLETIYRRASDATRYKVVSDLIGLEYDGAHALLIEALENDKNPLVRHEAAFGLGILGKSSDHEVLIHAMLNDTDPMVRHEAAIALAVIARRENLPALETALKDSLRAVSASADYAIQTFQLKLYREEAFPNV